MSDFEIADRLRSFDRNFIRQKDLIESIKGIVIGLERDQREQRRSGIDLAAAVVRSLVCRLKTMGRSDMTPEQACEHLYKRTGAAFNQARQALSDLPGLVQRASVSPAQTGVSGWASELVGSENYSGLLPSLAPASVYAQLSSRGLRLDFAGRGIVKIPGRAATPSTAGDFIAEAAPIPTRRLGAITTSVGPPKKLAMISYFSQELSERSVPTIENVLRQQIADDTSNLLDSKLLDNVAATTARPAGLLDGVSVTVATAGGGLGALSADLSNLATAIPAATDLVYIMTPADQMRALTVAPGLLGAAMIAAPYLTPKTVIAVDAADFVSGEGDQPSFAVSSQATIHDDDTTPLPISSVGSPNIIAAPSISLFQQNLMALRLIQHVTWTMRRTGRVAFTQAVTW